MEKDRDNKIDINVVSSSDSSEAAEEGPVQEMDNESEISGAEKGEAGTREYEARIKELNDKYVRLYAEFENYRKRLVREKEDIAKYGSEPLLFDLLTVIDTLELALGHADDNDSPGTLKQGIEMTLKEFNRVLGKHGLRRIEALGKPFDPAFHEAMSQVVREDVDEGIVVEEFRKGYKFYDKLLRPSLVAVSMPLQDSAAGDRDSGKNDNDNDIKEEKENG